MQAARDAASSALYPIAFPFFPTPLYSLGSRPARHMHTSLFDSNPANFDMSRYSVLAEIH